MQDILITPVAADGASRNDRQVIFGPGPVVRQPSRPRRRAQAQPTAAGAAEAAG